MTPDHHFKRPVFIAGSGRSGTTWIQDLLAEANGRRTVFEPMHPAVMMQARPFVYRFCEPDAEWPELKCFMELVFSGSIRNIWTDYRTRPDRVLPSLRTLLSLREVKLLRDQWRKLLRNRSKYRAPDASGLIIKEIRANLLAEWLARHFDAAVVYVVRHPGAVVSSQLRQWISDWDYRPVLQVFLGDRALNDAFLSPYRSRLSNIRSDAFGLAAVWCIENIVPVRRFRRHRWPIVYYEHLIHSGETEWPRLTHAAGLTTTPSIVRRVQPSEQADKAMRYARFDERQLTRWMEHVPAKARDDIQRALDLFEVDLYNVNDPLPINEGSS